MSILAAVSGGRDSVVLVDLLHKDGHQFEIAHCNFHLRDSESDRDEHFVRDLANRYGVPCHVAHFDTANYAAEHKLSVEMAARELRYEWFERVRRDRELDLIAVAHHRDDAIETFFINLLRGTGLAGLCGMKERNGNIIRPLLHTSRETINRYIDENRLQYVDDCTNATDLYLRNRIRHQLIPLLRELSPAFDSTMARNLHNLSDANEIMQASLSSLRSKKVTRQPDGIDRIAICDIDSLVPQATLLFELLRPYGFSADVVGQVIAGLHGESGRQYCSATHLLVKDRDTLQIAPLDQPDSRPQITISAPFPRRELAALKTKPDTILCDADTLRQPLALRHWRDGDRFHPFGMKGTRLLSDYFSDLKLSLLEKQHQWLLCDAAGRIVWVVGRRPDARFALTPETSSVIKITAEI